MRYTNLLVDDYYYWLLDLIDDYNYPTDRYSKLLELLFRREFYDLVANDCNRTEDGYELRTKFADEIGEHLYFVMDELPDFCSVLEMLIALAIKWEDNIAWDPDYGDRAHEWFWLMLENLRLTEFDNERFDEAEVNQLIYIFLERKYERNGDGGLFIVENPEIDMRKKEIWYQMNYFFDEHPELII